jgi:hypothetical protein
MNFFHIKKGRREEFFFVFAMRLAALPSNASSAADAAGRIILRRLPRSTPCEELWGKAPKTDRNRSLPFFPS